MNKKGKKGEEREERRRMVGWKKEEERVRESGMDGKKRRRTPANAGVRSDPKREESWKLKKDNRRLEERSWSPSFLPEGKDGKGRRGMKKTTLL
ncbi:hypothetical protein G7K_6870-t1 [Saitoella complicata NRRL Y-17804]|uniref:Uncharacterized protein n=1 Tax=Saitoella complicata (strain BCRC 22490 / CBS 7301 / JCM 7358 / NBRC 10748 / NRRL Y-17804) TaxID=698492 RepID=A0A0E9NSR0_SAICN|nr:hypothetical protein G7K_6870-t1 [Saitoella complicata NRRL Y-17804]